MGRDQPATLLDGRLPRGSVFGTDALSVGTKDCGVSVHEVGVGTHNGAVDPEDVGAWKKSTQSKNSKRCFLLDN